MATNPSIILSGNNINDIITDQRAKLAQADAMQKAGQLQDLQLSQAKQAFDDDKNFRRAYMEANGDPALTIKTAAALGVSPTRIQAFQKTQSEMLTQALTQHKLKTDTDKTELEKQDLKNSAVHGALAPALEAAPDKFESAKAFVISDLRKKQLISDDEAKQAAGMSQDDLKLYSAHLLNVKQISDQAKGNAALENADSSKRQANVAEDKLAIEKAKAITEQDEKSRVDSANKLSNALRMGGPAGYAKALKGVDPKLVGEFPTPEQIATSSPKDAIGILDGMAMTGHERAQVQQAHENLVQTQVRDANTAANEARNAALRGREVATSESRERREAESGAGATLETASPEVKLLAQGLVDGKYSPAEVRRMKGGQGALVVAQQLDDTWTDQRYQTLKNFKTGKDAENLATLVMAGQHLERFMKNSADAGLTGAINPFSKADARLQTDANDLSGVMGRLTKGGMLSVKEHSEYMDRLHSKIPGKREAAADELNELVQGRVEGLKDKFEKGTGYAIPDALLKGVKQTGPAQAAPAQAAPAKVATLADIKAYAQHAGISTDEAVSKFQKGGYKVQ